MRVVLLNALFSLIISVCHTESNITNSSTVVCGKCSPCWNIFSQNFGPCSAEEYGFSPFSSVQPMCLDTMILFSIMFLSIIILIPTCLWLSYVLIKRCRNTNATYVVNEQQRY